MAKKVLIADDEPNILISLEFLMQREGHAVSVARDGDEALAAIRKDRPDLVLLDVMMPARAVSTSARRCAPIPSSPASGS
jgi:DNA-binding response OmpR family regulator